MVRPVRVLILVAALALAGACGKASPDTGGSGERPDPPVGRELRTDWKQAGIGEAVTLAVADFDGDGAADLVVGGRRVSLVRPDSLEPSWRAGWTPSPEDSVLANGENDWASALALVPRSDGPPAVLACNSHGDAYLFDGRTGETIWHVSLDVEFPFCESVALFGPDDAPLFFPRYGESARSSIDGGKAWMADVPRGPFFVAAARRAGEPPGLVALTSGVGEDVKPAHDISAAFEKEIPPAVHVFGADGALAWRATLEQSDYPIVAAVADLDGAGTDSPVVAFDDGRLRAYDTQGEVLWEEVLAPFAKDPARTIFQALLAKDADGDGRSELFAVAVDARFSNTGVGPGVVLAFSPDGEELWRLPFTRSVEHASLGRLDGEDLLFLGVGPRDRVTKGEALAIRLAPDAEPRIAVQVATPHTVYSMATIPDPGGDRLAIGGLDGLLRVVRAADGAPAWSRHLSSWLTTMTTVEAPGGDWVVVGDAFANLAAVDEAGLLRWTRRMETKITGETMALASGDLGDGDVSVAAGALVLDDRAENLVGVVEVLSREGALLRSSSLPGPPLALAVVRDLDVPTLLAVHAPGPRETECRLAALGGADLTVGWSVPLSPCIRSDLSVGDLDGDGRQEYAVRVEPPSGNTSFVVLVGAGGELIDFHQESLERSLWVKIVPGGILSGGAAIGSQGVVSFRPIGAASREGWRVLLPSKTDESRPIGPPLPGDAVAAALVPDRNGDGVDEIAVSTAANDVILLDGATGAPLWTTNLEPSAIPDPEKHLGGPLAFLPGAGDLPPALVVTQGSEHRSRSRIFALSLEGELLGSVPTDAETVAVTVAGRADGTAAAVVAAGHSTYAVRTHEASK